MDKDQVIRAQKKAEELVAAVQGLLQNPHGTEKPQALLDEILNGPVKAA